MITITNAPPNRGEIMKNTVLWFLKFFKLPTDLNVHVAVQRHKGCYGTCQELEGLEGWEITVDPRLGLRDLISTLIHEMVHVWQWVSGSWEGDGEREAERLSGLLTPVFMAEYFDAKI